MKECQCKSCKRALVKTNGEIECLVENPSYEVFFAEKCPEYAEGEPTEEVISYEQV